MLGGNIRPCHNAFWMVFSLDLIEDVPVAHFPVSGHGGQIVHRDPFQKSANRVRNVLAVYGKDQYLIFSLNEHKYCLHATFIRELINLKNLVITKIPYTPSFILGITNLKGNFYSILDLKNFINIKPDKTNTNIENEKVIILESNEIKLALLVDDIINLVTISKENINIKNDKNLDDLFIKAETYINNEICNILNIDKLINDNRLYIDNSTN